MEMSLKKELLNELTKQQLEELAKSKGISFKLNARQQKYYEGWDEREKLIDLMNDHQEITVSDIEQFIVKRNP